MNVRIQHDKARLPTHVPVVCEGTGLQKDSIILAEQIRTLDKRRLRERIGTLRPEVMDRVAEAEKELIRLMQEAGSCRALFSRSASLLPITQILTGLSRPASCRILSASASFSSPFSRRRKNTRAPVRTAAVRMALS